MPAPSFSPYRIDPRASINQGLVGWWRFNNAGVIGLSCADLSSKKLIGTRTNGPTLLPSPVGAGSGLGFNGSNQYVSVASGIDLVNVSFSISAWAKRTNTGSDAMIVGQGVGSNFNGLQVGYRADNRITFDMWGNGINAGNYTDADWHLVTATYDSGGGTMSIYRDAALVTSGASGGNYTGSGELRIGDMSAFSCFFGGGIADVRIWRSRVLTLQEISQLYGDHFGLLGLVPAPRPLRGTISVVSAPAQVMVWS